jgi:hypothetical protein
VRQSFRRFVDTPDYVLDIGGKPLSFCVKCRGRGFRLDVDIEVGNLFRVSNPAKVTQARTTSVTVARLDAHREKRHQFSSSHTKLKC